MQDDPEDNPEVEYDEWDELEEEDCFQEAESAQDQDAVTDLSTVYDSLTDSEWCTLAEMDRTGQFV